MHKLIYKPKAIHEHRHEWHYREKSDGRGFVIQGYICECGRRAYIGMVRGIASALPTTI